MAALMPMRAAYGTALVELGRARPEVVALSADVQTSDYSFMFGDAYPDRYFNVGIAEQCLIDVAVGLAYEGLIPFVNTFAVFMASRALEPVLTHLSYGGANVKLMAGYSGLSPQMEGPTHHAIADLAAMRALPGMTIVSPADDVAMRALLPQVAAWPGPVYYRFCRNEVPGVFDAAYEPLIGSAHLVHAGRDVALVGVGTLLSRCMDAAEELAKDGIQAAVVDLHTIKPIDTEMILRVGGEAGAMVVAEEHNVLGGAGSAVAEVLSEEGLSVPLARVGVSDRFAESGSYYAMLDKFGMGVADIVRAARKVVARKRAIRNS